MAGAIMTGMPAPIAVVSKRRHRCVVDARRDLADRVGGRWRDEYEVGVLLVLAAVLDVLDVTGQLGDDGVARRPVEHVRVDDVLRHLGHDDVDVRAEAHQLPRDVRAPDRRDAPRHA